MRSTQRTVVLAVLLLASAPAVAEVGTALVFPSCANTKGLFGADFKTRVNIYNPNPLPMKVFLGLLTPEGKCCHDGAIIDLFPGSHYWRDNLLSEVFDYTGGASLVVMDTLLSSSLFATAEVYTEGPSGRFTTPVTGLTTKDRVPRQGEAGYALVEGLRVNSDNRANFGCGNVDDVSATVTATFSAWDGSKWDSVAVDILVPGEGWNQLPVPAQVQGELVSIRFNVKYGGGPNGTYCYGVKVNNLSNDGTAIPAQRFPR